MGGEGRGSDCRLLVGRGLDARRTSRGDADSLFSSRFPPGHYPPTTFLVFHLLRLSSSSSYSHFMSTWFPNSYICSRITAPHIFYLRTFPATRCLTHFRSPSQSSLSRPYYTMVFY